MPFRRVISKQLGELLLERRLLTREQLEQALILQRDRGGLLGQILIQLSYVTDEQIAQALTTQYGFPYIPVGGYDIDPAMIALIPESVARQYWLVPLDRIGQTLTIAMADPLNQKAIEDIEYLTKCEVQVFIATLSDVRQAIERYYKPKPQDHGSPQVQARRSAA